VISGTVVDARQGTVKLDKVWRGKELPAEIVIDNLTATGAQTGDAYIFPLTLERTGGRRFLVTESLLPNGAPLIYPATAEAIEMLESILAKPEG
jgi:hypothetical protein